MYNSFSVRNILGIVNEFIQYVQSYFQYLYTPIQTTIDDININWKSW